MRPHLRILLLVGVMMGVAYEGEAREFVSSPSTPGAFSPLPACKLEYVFSWSDLVEAARATVTYHPGAEDLRVTVKGKTTGAARLLWRLDARHDAIIDPVTLHGRWMEQYEVYRNRNIETRVAFLGAEGVRRFRRVNPDKNLTAKWKPIRIPDPFDILGGVLFTRSQPLNNGDTLTVIGFPGDSAYEIKLKVSGREHLQIMGQEMPVIRMEIAMGKIEFEKSRPVGMVPYQRFRSGTVWISDDAHRIPVRAEVRVFIGSVTGELVSAQFK